MIDIIIHIIKLLQTNQTNDAYTLPLVACQMVLLRIIVFNKNSSLNLPLPDKCYLIYERYSLWT